MSSIPETEEPRPTRQDAPFAALRESLGISPDAVLEPPAVEGEEFMAHAAFEAQRDAAGKPRYAEPTSCEGTLRIQDDSGGVWPVLCDACGFEVGVNIGVVAPDRLLERRYASAGIPEAFRGRAFDKTPEVEHELAVCRDWLRRFRPNLLADAIPAIALFGGTGRGKSHLLSLMIETLLKRGVDAMYRSQKDLLDELQAGLDEQTYESRWQRALRVPVLALDDLGAGRWTDWRRDRFEGLVDYRFAHSLPLLIATNVPPHVWDEKFGDRPASRLRGMTVRLHLQGPDRRGGEQQTLGAPA